MKKIFLFSALVASLSFMSCDEDAPKNTISPNSVITGFPSKSIGQNFLTNVTSATFDVPVNLISYVNDTYPATDITLQISVDPSSTAIAGTNTAVDNYAPLASNTVTIKAGSSSASFPITCHPSTFDPFAPRKLVLNISAVNTNNAIIGDQFKQVVITLQGVCPSALAGNYVWITSTATRPAPITEVAVGKYSCAHLPPFTAAYSWEFVDVCNQLTMTGKWTFESSNPITGTPPPMPKGTVLPNGNLSWTGLNVGGTSVSNRSFILTKI